ncbi:hypothetical protein EX30DRAFT_321075 [Ascodesmis nigricans]|uniref:K Homology domain-containing protein n=1 Tax=Ascodesmis nigricans TaxID=341454 RepID=A0A4V6RHD4_9PEZI|nr:hypothetical protein EX30DRAFT_321075 [Ascodesmis nigricans]
MAESINGDSVPESVVSEVNANGSVEQEEKPVPELTPAEQLQLQAEQEAAAAEAAAPKVNGKKSTGLDVTSDEAFPSLGGPAKAPAVRQWGAKHSGSAANLTGTGSTWTPQISSGGHQLTHELLKENKRPESELRKPAADLIREIMKKTGTQIERQNIKITGATIYIINGTPAARLQAKKLINKEFAAKGIHTVSVPAGVRPFIIGKKGAKIQELQTKTGTNIKVQAQADDQEIPDDYPINITVEGDGDGVAEAVRLIQLIVSERVIKIHRRIECPGQYYPFIAGPFQSNVERWEEMVDKVIVPEYITSGTPPPNYAPPSGPIEVHGEKNAVELVVKEIHDKIAEIERAGYTHSTAGLGQSDRNKIRLFTRNKGKLIQQVLQETGSTVITPPSNVQAERLIIFGPLDAKRKAIANVYEKMDQVRVNALELCRPFATAAIGAKPHARNVVRHTRRKPAIRAIESECNVDIEWPPSSVLNDPTGSCVVHIIAASDEALLSAKNRFIEFVGAYASYERFDYVDVDPLHHKHVRGKDTKNTEKIGAAHSVELLFPEESDDEQIVLIYEGASKDKEEMKQALEATKAQIAEVVKSQANIVTVTLDVVKELHDKIRGDRGTILNALNPSGVAVQFGEPKPRPGRVPPAEQTADTITLRGPDAHVETARKNILAFLKSTEAQQTPEIITVAFEYNKQFSGNLIGQKGANLNKLRDELGVDVKLNEGSGEIRGVQVCVDAAKKKIFQHLKELEDKATVVVKVPQQYHSVIIGSEGSTVRRLEDRYNVRINFPRAGKGEDAAESKQAADEIIIKGSKKEVEEARKEVTDLWKYEAENSHTATISVTARTIGFMFKTASKDIKQLREESTARIMIPQEDKSADPETKLEIKIKGQKDAVQHAKNVLSAIANTAENTSSRTITVDKKYHRSLIGQGGSTLKSIVVSAGGPDDRAALARMVRFPNQGSDSNEITVQGNSAVVDKIIEAIETIVEEKKNQITSIIEVAPESHRKLIGREGSTRKELESTFNVSIDIPRQKPNQANVSSEIKITGTPESVEKATEHILELVKEPEGETVEVPRYLHHSIAEGSFFKHLHSKYKVSVDHNGVPRPPKPADVKQTSTEPLPLIIDDDAAQNESWEIVENTPTEDDGTYPWVLRGTPDNIAKAKVELEKAIANAKKQSCTGFLVLPDPRKYRFVVGPGGSTVDRIRKETGCRITIPRNQAAGEAIVIHGSKESVEKAKEAVLEVVKKSGSGEGRRY